MMPSGSCAPQKNRASAYKRELAGETAVLIPEGPAAPTTEAVPASTPRLASCAVSSTTSADDSPMRTLT